LTKVDYFHELIGMQEAARMHALGHYDGLGAGSYIGLPLVMRFATPAHRDKIVTDVLSGEKHLCLCVSEAFAGSDVAGMKTVAKKSADGKYYTVTGTKKWITNGHWADYVGSFICLTVYLLTLARLQFVVACRTEKGMVVLFTERVEGIATKLIKTSYSTAAGTAFVTFDNVKIPAENLLGPEDGGLIVVLSNFNHERWGMTAGVIGAERTIIEECLK
jgi:alkylation response protein AidB-like acyl-CoA dehydrogenase